MKFICCVDIRQSFYNMKPLAEIDGAKIKALTSADREELFPESKVGNINLYYDYHGLEQINFMKSNFLPNSLMILEAEPDELEDNYMSDGSRNPTGYKIPAVKFFLREKIRELSDENIYQIIDKSNMEINDNFFREKRFEVHDVTQKTHVLVSHRSKDIYYGPYVVEEREIDRVLQIMPAIRESLFLVSGYRVADIDVVTIEDNWAGKKWRIAKVAENTVKVTEDVIEDDDLVENFHNSIITDGLGSANIPIKELPQIVSKSSASYLANSKIPKDIRENRAKRLTKKLASAQNLTENFSTFADILSKAVVSFIQSNPSSEDSDAIVQRMFDTNPNLIEQIKDQRLISSQIEKGKQEIETIAEQKKALSDEISSLEETKATIERNIDIEVAKQEKNKEILELEEKKKEAEAKLDEINESLECAKDILSLQKEKEELNGKIRLLNEHATYATESFQEIFLKNQKKMQEIVFDGFVSNKLIQAAAAWKNKENSDLLKAVVASEKKIPTVDMKPQELVDYLYRMIHKARPSYKKNVVTNIAICMFQSFLTVFSGEPGCGKTSICNLMAQVLGLNKVALYNEQKEGRYIQVSVERGWTSKRDLIGYYNPLSKSFDKSDRRLFDGLNLLSLEKASGVSRLPFVVLLDEANLSPMEYYWADFMNACDDLKKNDRINFGEDYIFSIPETLHFVATINNDHTTETLSPRLVDRAFIITLPHSSYSSLGKEIDEKEIELVSWNSIKEAFIPTIEADYELPLDIKQIYDDKIKVQLQKMRKTVSTRTDLAIKRYFAAASNLFEKEEEFEDVSLTALDYAIAQKVLPKLNGSGTEFRLQLEGLRDICRDNGLYASQERIQEIITNGNNQMGYYNFFG